MNSTQASLAVDPVFAAFGAAATYHAPEGGAGLAVTVLLARPDEVAALSRGLTRALAPHTTVEVRAKELAAPAKGGRFALAAGVYEVQEPPRLQDPTRLVWTCACVEVSA